MQPRLAFRHVDRARRVGCHRAKGIEGTIPVHVICITDTVRCNAFLECTSKNSAKLDKYRGVILQYSDKTIAFFPDQSSCSFRCRVRRHDIGTRPFQARWRSLHLRPRHRPLHTDHDPSEPSLVIDLDSPVCRGRVLELDHGVWRPQLYRDNRGQRGESCPEGGEGRRRG